MSDSTCERATFGAGCFWGVEETFRTLPGVTATRVGYTGGHSSEPSYRDVCSGQTGHAEAVEIEFSPEKIGYQELLEVFWDCHDPTTRNRQGPDVGSQYRSAIFCHSDAQISQAEASKRARDETASFAGPIVTEVVPATTFHQAEDDHQQYLQKRGQGGCNLE